MESILNSLLGSSNTILLHFTLLLAVIRVYLELVGVDLGKWPVSRYLARGRGAENIKKFHRNGLYFSIGYILFFAPTILLRS